MIYIVGIDEAGRGPCIGPLVIAGVKIKITQLPLLKKLGVKDSKKIEKRRRESIAREIKTLIEQIEYYIIPPEKIKKKSLTLLEIEGISSIIQKIEANEYIVDAIVNRKGIYKVLKQIREKVGEKKARVRMEIEADSKYIPVSVASIFAKVKRDKEIEKLHKIYGNFGSGYPSDPKTRTFLNKFKGNLAAISKIIRSDWKTISDLKEARLLKDE